MSRRPPLWLLLLALAGAALIFVAIFIPYEQIDVGTKLALDRTSVWNGLEPFVFAVGCVLAVSVVYSRSTALASGLLLGFGVGALIFYGDSIGYISLSEAPLSLRAGNFVGLVGALMVIGTGVAALRSSTSRSR